MVEQPRPFHVKLTDLIEGLELQSDERFSSLNMITGEVVSVTREELRAAEEDAPLKDFPEWQHDALRIARDVVETDHYLPLPTQFDLHEYSIMERFCLAVEDDDICDDLYNAIHGRGAFRRFKDRIHAYGMAEAWYRYRDAALREIAIAWCEAHDIRYTET